MDGGEDGDWEKCYNLTFVQKRICFQYVLQDNTKFSWSPETWLSCEVTSRFFKTFHLYEKNEILSYMFDPSYNLTLNNPHACLY